MTNHLHPTSYFRHTSHEDAIEMSLIMIYLCTAVNSSAKIIKITKTNEVKMNITKISLISLYTLLVMFAAGCSKSNNNPVSSSNSSSNNVSTLKGTWKLNYTGNSDTLNVTLDINGSNNNVEGNWKVYYENNKRTMNNSGSTLSGSYADSVVDVSTNGLFSNFNFAGKKSGSNYKGLATLIVESSPFFYADTLVINNAVLVKQ